MIKSESSILAVSKAGKVMTADMDPVVGIEAIRLERDVVEDDLLLVL